MNIAKRKQGAEPREDARYHASWRAAIVRNGKILYEGRTKDISAGGAAILFQYNIKPGSIIELHILIPALNNESSQRVVIVHGITCNATHDSKYYCFRVGISFQRYEVATDRDYLTKFLTNHHRAVPKSRYAPL